MQKYDAVKLFLFLMTFSAVCTAFAAMVPAAGNASLRDFIRETDKDTPSTAAFDTAWNSSPEVLSIDADDLSDVRRAEMVDTTAESAASPSSGRKALITLPRQVNINLLNNNAPVIHYRSLIRIPRRIRYTAPARVIHHRVIHHRPPREIRHPGPWLKRPPRGIHRPGPWMKKPSRRGPFSGVKRPGPFPPPRKMAPPPRIK